jgi:urocanate hydratase
MSDMAHHSWAGNIARGMTMCVLSNGGGVGTGKAINGGFGLVLDGSERVNNIIRSAIEWDVNCGVARRAWARNENALTTAYDWNLKNQDRGHITLPFLVKDDLLNDVINVYLKKYK